MWCVFGLFVPVTVRSRRPFTSGHFIDHVDSASHKKNFAQYEHLENKKSAAAAKYGSVSEKYIIELKVMSGSQVVLGKLFAVKLKNKNQYVDLSHASGEVQ